LVAGHLGVALVNCVACVGGGLLVGGEVIVCGGEIVDGLREAVRRELAGERGVQVGHDVALADEDVARVIDPAPFS
jgi:hypothetical protein